jgi:hypothetical protein
VAAPQGRPEQSGAVSFTYPRARALGCFLLTDRAGFAYIAGMPSKPIELPPEVAGRRWM